VSASLIERAALAMLDYEAWLAQRSATQGGRFDGITAEEIIDTVAENIADWAYLSGLAIQRATELRGMSATARRTRGQRARRKDQRTGRRTIPKKITRRAA
jgi:hypothetical protein